MTLAVTNEGEVSIPLTQGIGNFSLNCTSFMVENFQGFEALSTIPKDKNSHFRRGNNKEVNALALSSKSKNTHKQMKWSVTIF